MAITPILHRILVAPDKIENKDSHFAAARRAGIVIVEDERKREQAAVDTGTVLNIGATAFKDFGADFPPIAAGHRIVYARYAGKAVKDGDEDYVLLNDEDVLAILSEGA